MKPLNRDVRFFDIDGISMLGNPQNGAIIGLNSFGINYIKSGRPASLSVNKDALEIEAALQRLGFLDENKLEKSLEAAYVHVTDRCNLHCIGCYSFINCRNDKSDLSIEKICYIFNQLKSVCVSRVVISGGEPFLRKDLAQICQYARNKCNIPYISIISNGFIDENCYLPVLPFIDELNISVDGFNETTRFIRDEGIMPTVLQTIKKLQPHIPINLIFTLHKKNMNYMNEYAKLAKSLNVTHSYSMFTATPNNPLFHEFMFTEKDLAQVAINFLEQDCIPSVQDVPISQTGLSCRDKCEAGNKIVSIAANGDVYPCHMLHIPEMILGNLADMQSSLTDIVFSNNNPFQALNCSMIRACNECKYKPLCGAGCRGRSYLFHNDIFSPDAYCSFIKSFYIKTISNIKDKLASL